eukprot:6123526-Prymnesium_polylepis.1
MSSTSSRHVDGEPSQASHASVAAIQSVLRRVRDATKLALIYECDGSPSTCRLDVELIPEPSWFVPMDTIPNVGS